MNWSSDYNALPNLLDIKWSDSREVVEVPGGAEWKIRRLQEELPEFCWKYCGTSPIAQYYFEMASRQIFVPVACTCLVRGEWCRAKISKLNGNSSVLVELVDYGTEVFSNLSNVRPLLLKFGRIPPMALKCRVKDVYINDLNAKKVEEFRRIINECNRLVRVELLTATEPFLINIFHPTLEGENIGKLFYTPVEDENHDLAKERRWLEHLRRQSSEDDDYFETNEESDYEIDNGVEHLYIRRFPRSPKPSHVGSEELFVGHIENSRLIYLHFEWMITRWKEIENSIAEQWCSLPKLPSKWFNINTACAACLDGSFYRASITYILEDSIQMLLIDHGRQVSVDKVMGDLRVLPPTDLYVEPPMVIVMSLDIASEPFPHPSCTALLREILPAGTQVQFLSDKRHKRLPPRGKLIVVESSLDVERHLWQRLRKAGVQLQCRELVPFQPDNPWLKYRSAPDTKFIHRLQCPSVLLRGKLELAPLEYITA